MANVSRREVPAVIVAGGTIGQTINVEDGKGVTLLANTTYVFMLSDADAPFGSIHLKWDSALVFNGQFEDSDMPRKRGEEIGGSSDDDIPDVSVAKGDWIIWPMPAANVSVISTDASTGGGTYTAGTGVLAVVGGTAGGAMIHMADLGSKRGRYKVAVQGTGGVLRVTHHRKS